MFIEFPLAVMTLAWWGVAVAAPAVLAARALRKGRWAMKLREFERAERYLGRAAEREDLREEAVGLMAESALRGGRPGDALAALDGLFAEEGIELRNSKRVMMLRGVACSVMRQGRAAVRTLAEVGDRADATVEEQLALAQAYAQAKDVTAARAVLAEIRPGEVEGAVRARKALVEAALHWQEGAWQKAMDALPELGECTERDRKVVRSLRWMAAGRGVGRGETG